MSRFLPARSTSSGVRRASTNSTSAPAFIYSSQRCMASSQPVTAMESVRTIMVKSSSVRASTAARIFWTMSTVEITFLSSKWPQRLGDSWSSMWMAATPARSYSLTVLRTFKTPPYPVSASAITGTSTTAVRDAALSTISVMVASARSG